MDKQNLKVAEKNRIRIGWTRDSDISQYTEFLTRQNIFIREHEQEIRDALEITLSTSTKDFLKNLQVFLPKSSKKVRLDPVNYFLSRKNGVAIGALDVKFQEDFAKLVKSKTLITTKRRVQKNLNKILEKYFYLLRPSDYIEILSKVENTFTNRAYTFPNYFMIGMISQGVFMYNFNIPFILEGVIIGSANKAFTYFYEKHIYKKFIVVLSQAVSKSPQLSTEERSEIFIAAQTMISSHPYFSHIHKAQLLSIASSMKIRDKNIDKLTYYRLHENQGEISGVVIPLIED